MAIFALVGQSSSGKSTVESNLMSLGYPRIISYTTRGIRKNEEDGVAYHFIDTETFHELKSNGFFAETAIYNGWSYGLSIDWVDYKNKDYIAVVTVSGYEELVRVVGKQNIVGIHIKVEERERIIRQLKRGDEVDEVIRRIHADRIDFAEVEDICDYVVVNDDINSATNYVDYIIKTQHQC